MSWNRVRRGDPVSVFLTGTADVAYDATDRIGALSVRDLRLGDGTLVSLPVSRAGVALIPGDILPTFLQALQDAVAYRRAVMAACRAPDGLDCGRCQAALSWIEQYERLLDAIPAGG